MKALALMFTVIVCASTFFFSTSPIPEASTQPVTATKVELVIRRITPNQRLMQIGEFPLVTNRFEYERLKGVRGIEDVRRSCEIEYSLMNRTDESYLLSSLHMLQVLVTGLQFKDEEGNSWILESKTVERMHGEGVAYTIPCLAGIEHAETNQITLGTLRPEKPNPELTTKLPKTLSYTVKEGVWVDARVVLIDSLGKTKDVELAGSGELRVQE